MSKVRSKTSKPPYLPVLLSWVAFNNDDIRFSEKIIPSLHMLL